MKFHRGKFCNPPWHFCTAVLLLLRWTPKGQLLAHIHEHKDSINRYVYGKAGREGKGIGGGGLWQNERVEQTLSLQDLCFARQYYVCNIF